MGRCTDPPSTKAPTQYHSSHLHMLIWPVLHKRHIGLEREKRWLFSVSRSNCLHHPFLSRAPDHVQEVLGSGLTSLPACASFVYLSLLFTVHLLLFCLSISVFSIFQPVLETLLLPYSFSSSFLLFSTTPGASFFPGLCSPYLRQHTSQTGCPVIYDVWKAEEGGGWVGRVEPDLQLAGLSPITRVVTLAGESSCCLHGPEGFSQQGSLVC